MTDLLPCPFCGSTDLRMEQPDRYTAIHLGDDWWGECQDCLARGGDHKSKHGARDLWNTRPSLWQPIETAPPEGQS